MLTDSASNGKPILASHGANASGSNIVLERRRFREVEDPGSCGPCLAEPRALVTVAADLSDPTALHMRCKIKRSPASLIPCFSYRYPTLLPLTRKTALVYGNVRSLLLMHPQELGRSPGIALTGLRTSRKGFLAVEKPLLHTAMFLPLDGAFGCALGSQSRPGFSVLERTRGELTLPSSLLRSTCADLGRFSGWARGTFRTRWWIGIRSAKKIQCSWICWDHENRCNTQTNGRSVSQGQEKLSSRD